MRNIFDQYARVTGARIQLGAASSWTTRFCIIADALVAWIDGYGPPRTTTPLAISVCDVGTYALISVLPLRGLRRRARKKGLSELAQLLQPAPGRAHIATFLRNGVIHTSRVRWLFTTLDRPPIEAGAFGIVQVDDFDPAYPETAARTKHPRPVVLCWSASQ